MKLYLIYWAALFFFSVRVSARTFYVKNLGNDAASGLSITDAWKSTLNVNSTDFNIGDSILFEAGSIFHGGIYLSEEDSTSIAKPLYIGSYGTGHATIYAHKSFGIYAYNVGTVYIDRIDFSGLDADSSASPGIFFYTDNPAGKKYKQIILSKLNIFGFETGIQLGSWHNSYPGYSNIHISDVNAGNNLKNGIASYDMAEKTGSKLAHDSLYISDCYLRNNGFSGLTLGGINYGIIERVKASRSGQLHNKGVVGIWVWNSKNVHIQYCVADSTRTDGGDGGGFDIDGGTENCIVQYCYSYFNDGPGFMHCDYPQSRPTKNNILRYNISEADGQQPYKDKSSLCFISWGTGLSNCIMYNNTSFIGNKGIGTISGLQGNILEGFDLAPAMHNCKAFNNIVYAAGDSNYLVRIYNGKAFSIDTNALQMAANDYFSIKSISHRWNDGNTNYSSLNAWRSATDQEIFLGKYTGHTIDPDLKSPGAGGAIQFSQIDSLPYFLQAYTLIKTSYIIDSGINLKSTTGADIGVQDFFMNNSIFAYSQDIGCYESPFKLNIPEMQKEHISVFPNPFDDHIMIIIEAEKIPSNFSVYNINGQFVRSGMLRYQKNVISTQDLIPGIYTVIIDGRKTLLVKK